MPINYVYGEPAPRDPLTAQVFKYPLNPLLVHCEAPSTRLHGVCLSCCHTLTCLCVRVLGGPSPLAQSCALVAWVDRPCLGFDDQAIRRPRDQHGRHPKYDHQGHCCRRPRRCRLQALAAEQNGVAFQGSDFVRMNRKAVRDNACHAKVYT